MAASSVTGVGPGACDKATAGDLASLAVGPYIVFAGVIEVGEIPDTSPPTDGGTVEFPYPLPGGVDRYVVLLTTINAGSVYVTERSVDSGNNFTGFSFVTDSAGQVITWWLAVGPSRRITRSYEARYLLHGLRR